MTTREDKKRENTAELVQLFDVEDLIMSSVAYYLGRMTIQTFSFCNDLICAWPHLSDGVKQFVRRLVDEEFEREQRLAESRKRRELAGETSIGVFGQPCDRATWVQVRELWHKEDSIRFIDKDGVNNRKAVREFLGDKIVECAVCNNTGLKNDGHGGCKTCSVCRGHLIRFLSYHGKPVTVVPSHGDIIKKVDDIIYLIDRDHPAWEPEVKEATEPTVPTEAGPAPPQLNSAIIKNFATLRKAVINNDAALVSVLRATGEPASVVCAVNRLSDGSVAMIPIAEMILTDPFDLYQPPCPVKDIGNLQTDKTIPQN